MLVSNSRIYCGETKKRRLGFLTNRFLDKYVLQSVVIIRIHLCAKTEKRHLRLDCNTRKYIYPVRDSTHGKITGWKKWGVVDSNH
jgi:hypothetical protein